MVRSTFKFRSEIPSYTSWSPDGSLLAVSLGRYVALYDPDTTALLHLWTSRGFPLVVSARFVGRNGRYVAIAGLKDVLLWDLIAESGAYRWLHRRIIH